jgi:SOS-response transcriptional repressor LexA
MCPSNDTIREKLDKKGEECMDADPEPKTKGELRRQQILIAVKQFVQSREDYPSLQDIQQITGIRSFNTLSNQLKILQQQGVIEYDHKSVKLLSESV